MYRNAVSYPVLPGKKEAARALTAMLRSRPQEYSESRRALGVNLERVYYQETPMGDVVVAYTEHVAPLDQTIGALASSDRQIDKDFIEAIRDVHGVDLREPPPPGPAPETVGEWINPTATSRLNGLAFCAPLIPGKENAGRDFCSEAYRARKEALTAARQAIGATVEVVTLQATPFGPVICVYGEGLDPIAANALFAASTAPFDVWFKGELAGLFPPEVDFNEPIPANEQIFNSTELLESAPLQIILTGEKARTQAG